MTGILSYGLIGAPHFVHADAGMHDGFASRNAHNANVQEAADDQPKEEHKDRDKRRRSHRFNLPYSFPVSRRAIAKVPDC